MRSWNPLKRGRCTLGRKHLGDFGEREEGHMAPKFWQPRFSLGRGKMESTWKSRLNRTVPLSLVPLTEINYFLKSFVWASIIGGDEEERVTPQYTKCKPTLSCSPKNPFPFCSFFSRLCLYKDFFLYVWYAWQVINLRKYFFIWVVWVISRNDQCAISDRKKSHLQYGK